MASPQLWLPRQYRKNRKPVSVVFYVNRKLNGRILVGAPADYPAPADCEKIVCTTAAEVDLWDKKLRAQEKAEAEMTAEEREKIEGPIRDYVRKEMIFRLMTSRNEVNRQFCRAALNRLDEEEAKKKKEREERYMHCLAYEDGH